jgi:hypothetical protein
MAAGIRAAVLNLVERRIKSLLDVVALNGVRRDVIEWVVES